MIPVTTFRNKHVAVLGLGRSGIATARALKAGGAAVSAFDDDLEACRRAEAESLQVSDLWQADWSVFSALVLAPGAPLNFPKPHWAVTRAQECGIEVIGDIELFCRERAALQPKSIFVAITGSNGKSTTAALIAHLLSASQIDVQLGGNIGLPVLSLEPPANERIHVLELSSFQIETAPSLKPSFGVLLNITSDHLDRHGSMERYATIKKRCIAQADRPVIAIDDTYTRELAKTLAYTLPRPTLVAFNDNSIQDGMVIDGVEIYERRDGNTVDRWSVAGISSLSGRHNAQNAGCALAVVSQILPGSEQTQAGLRTFARLPHRMEIIDRVDNILFVNDSVASNAGAAASALACFESIFWIAGGRAKGFDFANLRDRMSNVCKAFLIGSDACVLAGSLDGACQYELCGTIERAVDRAFRDAALSGVDAPVILLSPGAASYDQFRNFEARGDRFKELVKTLKAHHQRPDA